MRSACDAACPTHAVDGFPQVIFCTVRPVAPPTRARNVAPARPSSSASDAPIVARPRPSVPLQDGNCGARRVCRGAPSGKPPSALMARRPRDRRLSIDYLLHATPPPAAAVGGQCRGWASTLRPPPSRREVATAPLGKETLSCDGDREVVTWKDGCVVVPGSDPPRPVPHLLLTTSPLSPPPRFGGAQRPAPPPYVGVAATPPPRSSLRCAHTRVGRAQRAALEARAWAESQAAAVGLLPPHRFPSSLAVDGPMFAPAAESPRLSGGEKMAAADRGWTDVGLGRPVTPSPVVDGGTADERLLQGASEPLRRDLCRAQPPMFAPWRPLDAVQPKTPADGPDGRSRGALPPSHARRRGPDSCNSAKLALGTPLSLARTPTGGLHRRDPPQRDAQPAAPPGTSSHSRPLAGAIAKARVPCSRGCGHTFGNRSGMFARGCGGGDCLWRAAKHR